MNTQTMQMTSAERGRVKLFLLSLILTIVLIRIFLFFSPETDLIIRNYEVHHLYTGAFILVVLTPFLLVGIKNKLTIILSGIGSSFVVDELVYLIVGPVHDSLYMTRVSLTGALFMVVISVFSAFLALAFSKKA